MNSIVQKDKKCFVCGSTMNLHRHHIMFGINRYKAERDGLTCYLCWQHHEGTKGVHGRDGHELDRKLKMLAQCKWCEYYKKSANSFIDRYGQWYYM